VSQEELTAEQWIERAYEALDPDAELFYYTEAIRLKPDYAVAFYGRGLAHHMRGDLDAALSDLTEAIRLKPDYVEAYKDRNVVHLAKGDRTRSNDDYATALRLETKKRLSASGS
jgi:tetratricopeptide (TPR) repeat protein